MLCCVKGMKKEISNMFLVQIIFKKGHQSNYFTPVIVFQISRRLGNMPIDHLSGLHLEL